MMHPLFGLFAEPASTVLLIRCTSKVSEIEKLAREFSFFCARIGTTGGDRLESSVYGDVLISLRDCSRASARAVGKGS